MKRKQYGPRKSPKSKNSKFIDKENEPVRLNKFLADAGVCSRRKADALIENGAVKVNGKTVTGLGTKIKRSDFVTVNGDPVKSRPRHIYILLNKPKDVITTTSDEKGRKTVMDIVRKRSRLFPVGRLDRNTTGALLITNDGELANRLMHPKYEIERIYNASLDKELKPEHAIKLSKGVRLDDGRTMPCEIFMKPGQKNKLSIALREGRNREVHRLFEAFGYTVKMLDRKYYANLSTKGLKRGEYRHLTRKEVNSLKEFVGIK